MGGLGTEKSKQPAYDRSPSFRNRHSFAEGIGTGAARARQGQTGARRRPQGRGDGNGIGVPLTRLTCANQARGNHTKNCPVAANPYGGNGAEILEWPINPPKPATARPSGTRIRCWAWPVRSPVHRSR